MLIRPSDLYPRLYRLHREVPTTWGNYERDATGHVWLNCGRFVFTTTPPSRYEDNGPVRKFLIRKGL